jgi:hypothetical protein
MAVCPPAALGPALAGEAFKRLIQEMRIGRIAAEQAEAADPFIGRVEMLGE